MTVVLPMSVQDPFKTAFPPFPPTLPSLRSLIQEQRDMMARLQPAYTRFDTPSHVYITLPKPAVAIEDLHLDYRDHTLVINGASKTTWQNHGKQASQGQISQSRFFRQIPLDEKIDPKKSTMTLDKSQENLLLSLPKLHPAKR